MRKKLRMRDLVKLRTRNHEVAPNQTTQKTFSDSVSESRNRAKALSNVP